MSRLIALTLLLTVVCLSAQQPAAPPRPDPGQAPMTFKVEVNYIEIDATVMDAQGNPVMGLVPRDFQLTEDDKPQTVTVFSHVALPVEPPDPAAVERGRGRTRRAQQQARVRRPRICARA